MSNEHGRFNDAAGTGLAIGLTFAFLAFTGAAVDQQIQHLGPHVGDIIVLHAGEGMPRDADGEVRAFATDNSASIQAPRTCTLRVPSMMAATGSIVVEAIDVGRPAKYRIQWAGGPISNDNAACAKASNLFVDRKGILTLVAAADGFGVSHPTRVQVVTSEAALAYDR